jgi:aminopeptidase N
MRHMRRWAMDESDQGPVYLGYRVGHIRSDRRAFRAIVYNKAAVVLHMLRKLVGDEAFFRGIRRFYTAARFTKAGTDDLRLAMEAESGRPLDRFFERWIYNATLPQVSLSYRVESHMGSMSTKGSTGSRFEGSRGSAMGSEGSGDPEGSREQVVLRFEQTGEIFDVPVTVRLRHEDGSVGNVDVALANPIEEVHLPLKGRLRSVDVNKDDGVLVDVKVR